MRQILWVPKNKTILMNETPWTKSRNLLNTTCTVYNFCNIKYVKFKFPANGNNVNVSRFRALSSAGYNCRVTAQKFKQFHGFRGNANFRNTIIVRCLSNVSLFFLKENVGLHHPTFYSPYLRRLASLTACRWKRKKPSPSFSLKGKIEKWMFSWSMFKKMRQIVLL